MKQIILICAVVALVGCGKKPAEEPVFEQERPDVTKPSKPPAKTEAQIEAETKTFAETKAKAEAGDAEEQGFLGWMYAEGKGVEQDFKEAVKWYQKAADQGDASAQFSLAAMYEVGKGVEQDYVTAYAWANIAAANGHKTAPKLKSEFLEKKMTPAQITKAEALVKEMVNRNPKLINNK